MRVLLVQIDGKLPNLALMKLAHWHRTRGDEVVLTRSIHPDIFYRPDRVYGSAIFTMSSPKIARFREQYPEGILAGTGTSSRMTVEELIGDEYEHYDYTDYPNFTASIGFTQRGCRLKCKFCVVPAKEGKPRSVNTVADIWRGEGHPKHLHLLDNDFFGQPEWQQRLDEIKAGDFKVCFNQGINVRLIDDTVAAGLSEIAYYDDGFKSRRLYTAWDNLKDEKIFFRGVDTLERHGVPASHLMAYMLVGFDPAETWERIFHRFDRMVERGIRPYPMVFDPTHKELKRFQRWAVRKYYEHIPFDEFEQSARSPDKTTLEMFA